MQPCSVCRRPIDEHNALDARRCLDTLEFVESQKYCRLTGPKKAEASA